MIKRVFREMSNFFTGRFPERQDILGVYAVVVLLVYTWTLIVSFYKLPSWIYYLTISQIVSIYSYAFLLNFAESILAVITLLALEFTVFSFFKNKVEFLSRSILAASVLLGSSMVRLALYKEYVDSAAFISGEMTWWSVTFLVGLPIVLAAPKNGLIRTILAGVADRALVFLYIYLPLSFIGLIVVIARNLY
jgi:hypothetical protein